MNTQPSWSSDSYEANTRFVSELGAGVVEWLAPKPGERILDLGCGDGVLTEKLVEAGADVVGFDQSVNFVEAARKRGLDVVMGDAHEMPFEAEFDAVFSNAALHWMLEPERVAAGVARALKPGGRFVGEMGGFGNVAAIATAMRAVGVRFGGDVSSASPWYFPTVAEYTGVLEMVGISVDRAVLFARPTPLPTGLRGWLGVMCQPFFDQFGEAADTVLEEVVAAAEPSLCDQAGNWIADYVRLRFEAHLA